MVKSIERATLLVPVLVVTGITIAAALVLIAVSRRPSSATPPAQIVLRQIAAESEKSPLDRNAANAIANALAHVEGVAAVTLDGKPVSNVGRVLQPASIESQICATIQTTAGPATLCADTRPRAASTQPITVIVIAAIAASLIGAAIATVMARRSILGVARAVDRRVAASGSGSLGTLSESVNRLLSEGNENEVMLRRRTLELESANKELEAFTFSASHDLRAPLASIDGFSQMLLDDYGPHLDEVARDCVKWIRDATSQMQELVDGLLQMSRFTRADLDREELDLSQVAHSVADGLRQRDPHRDVTFRIQDGVKVNADPRLMRAVLENLMANAWKFTGRHPRATIEFGVTDQNGRPTLFVRDDGAGFDPGHADKMFRAFQRLHTRQEFEGTGIGLATVERILHRHGGRIWAEGEVEKGATFYFVVGAPHAALPAARIEQHVLTPQ